MSELALDLGDGRILSSNDIAAPIRRRINDAKAARKPLEAVWQSNLAFAAGKWWLKWDRDQRRLVFPPELYDKDLYATDVITEYVMTALGELGSDDDRPELLLRHESEADERYQQQLNNAVQFGWDHEFDADEALEQVDLLTLVLGTAAIRCRWNPAVGNVKGEVPHVDGKPVYGRDEQAQLADQFQQGVIPGVKMLPVREGRIEWEPLSAMNLLVPPGIPDERRFNWEAVITSAYLPDVRAQYGDLAAELREDTDIGNALGLDANSEATDARGWGAGGDGSKPARVRDHVWLVTYYERPSPQWPNGRTAVLAGSKLTLLDHQPELPYQGPNGDYRSGISYTHWQRIAGRFWSRGLVEPLKDIQRGINEISTTKKQIIRRGLPWILIDQKQQEITERKGLPVEVVPVANLAATPQPVVNQGVAPGPWMQAEKEDMREDLTHATGISSPRLGENPANVSTYSQLALLHEADQTKREPIRRRRQRAIAELVESSVYDMRAYWGHDKEILLAGEEDRVDADIFDATQIPAFFIVRVAKGAVKPRSQAAELKKIEDLAEWALQCGIIAMNPAAWVEWRKESTDAGQVLELPTAGADEQQQKAELENHWMIQGELPVPEYYDPLMVHLPAHRQAQVQAWLAGDRQTHDRIEQHIQFHLAREAENAARMAALAPPAYPPGQEPQPQQPQQPPGGQT